MQQGLLGLVIALVLAGTGYFGALHWRDSQDRFQRLDAPQDCDLRAGPCRVALPEGSVSLSLSPADIPLMTTLTLQVRLQALAAREVRVDIRGLNMDMGLNRTRLRELGEGIWEGETILPVCSQRRMEWEAAVLIAGSERWEVPFPFHTTRP